MSLHLDEHQWRYILEDEEQQTSAEQRNAALMHLSHCPQCQSLVEAWRGVERWLQHAPMEAPAPGFTDRWQARLAIHRQRQARKQALIVVGVFILASFSILGLLFYAAWMWLQAAHLTLWVWLYRALELAFSLLSFRESVIAFGRAFMDSIPLIAWLFMVGAMCELLVLWLVSLRVWLLPGRVRR